MAKSKRSVRGRRPASTDSIRVDGAPAPSLSRESADSWPPPVSMIAVIAFAAVGIGISVYLTVAHYAKLSVLCPAGNGAFNCQAVTSSPYSVIGSTNVPITIPGIGWFAVGAALAGLAFWFSTGPRHEPRWLMPAHALWGALGVIFVLYLVYVEAVRLHQFCEWCSGVHLLVAGTFVLTLARWQRAVTARYV